MDILELAKTTTRNLSDNVVKGRLEVGGYSVEKLGESVSESNLSSGVRKRGSSSLGNQSGRTRQTSVDLDDTVIESVGLESVLNIALSSDSQVTDKLDSRRTEHVVLVVRQGLGRSNDDRACGVNSERVKVCMLQTAIQFLVALRATLDVS